MGLVWKSVPAEGLGAAVEDLARTMARIPCELLAANKSIVNKAMELMGRNTMQYLAAETDAIAYQAAPIVKEFSEMAGEQGLKVALEWRDGPFQDFRGKV